MPALCVNNLCVNNAILVYPGEGMAPGSLLVVEQRIAAINPTAEQIPLSCEHFDAGGALLTPGLVDIHTHGINEFLFERDPEDLLNGAAALARYGTTSVLPTFYTVLNRPSLARVERLANALDMATGVDFPGVHLEGPFLALPGAGATTVAGDLGLLDELLSAAQGRVRAMSVSPDCPNVLPVIEQLCEQGVSVFLTHTRASVAQTQAAIDAGARHATHFCNVFPAPPETEPGVRPVGAFEALLVDPRCTVDFICDGVHVDPIAIRLALLAKGPQGITAITDANIGAGSEDGVYPTPWGYPVRVSRTDAVRIFHAAHPLHGQLAGSSLTMDRAVSNLLAWLDLPPYEIWAMGTCNPARAVGLSRKGMLQVGADADLVLWEQRAGRLQAIRTWVRGTCVFDRTCSAEVKSWDHGKYVSI